MAHLVSLGLWLFLVTLFLLDTLVTLTFLGRYAEPAVRLGWWTALLLVPLVTLLVSPLWAWAAPAVALAAAGGLIVHGAAYRVLRRRLTAAPAEAAERIRALAEGSGSGAPRRSCTTPPISWSRPPWGSSGPRW